MLALRSLFVALPLLQAAHGSAIGALPPRYTNGIAGATFLASVEHGGITPGPNGPDQYADVYIQAIDGHIVFTQKEPTRICPCADDSFGAKNFTGYYVGGTNDKPTLQLFTSSPGAQYVYVAPDLSIRYTAPGLPVPPRANSTSIKLFDPEPLGGGLPSTSIAQVQGSITQPDGSVIYYDGTQFCAPPGSPPRTENGVGPLKISATRVKGNVPGGGQIVDKGCLSGYIESSVNAPKVGPWDIYFRTPDKPLVFAYKN